MIDFYIFIAVNEPEANGCFENLEAAKEFLGEWLDSVELTSDVGVNPCASKDDHAFLYHVVCSPAELPEMLNEILWKL